MEEKPMKTSMMFEFIIDHCRTYEFIYFSNTKVLCEQLGDLVSKKTSPPPTLDTRPFLGDIGGNSETFIVYYP